ncbi:MAG TPA: cytochrome c [Terriglobia bacterium]|nr:cytochrome c [Terriglobia bacterium]
MRAPYALAVCLFLLMIGVSRGQQNQPQKGGQSTQTTTPSTGEAPAQVPHQFVISPEEKARKNPVAFTEESVERGKKLFATQCAMCHGKNGDGKGDLVEIMHISPPDFTKPETFSKRTDGELFAIINTGSATMPGEAKRLKENQTWDLVNFLRTLEGKKPAKASGAEAAAAPQ